MSRRSNSTHRCLCGCDTLTKSNFAPGHDAKVKGAILSALKSGNPAELPSVMLRSGHYAMEDMKYFAQTGRRAYTNKGRADGIWDYLQTHEGFLTDGQRIALQNLVCDIIIKACFKAEEIDWRPTESIPEDNYAL